MARCCALHATHRQLSSRQAEESMDHSLHFHARTQIDRIAGACC